MSVSHCVHTLECVEACRAAGSSSQYKPSQIYQHSCLSEFPNSQDLVFTEGGGQEWKNSSERACKEVIVKILPWQLTADSIMLTLLDICTSGLDY